MNIIWCDIITLYEDYEYKIMAIYEDWSTAFGDFPRQDGFFLAVDRSPKLIVGNPLNPYEFTMEILWIHPEMAMKANRQIQLLANEPWCWHPERNLANVPRMKVYMCMYIYMCIYVYVYVYKYRYRIYI